MRRNTLSLLFALTFVFTLAALVQNFRFDNTLARERAGALATDREIGSLELGLSDLRAAETAYLAAGQGPDFWMRRVTEISGRLEATLSQLRSATQSPDAGAHYGAASSALADVMSIDTRTRETIERGQPLLASDLVFMEGLEPAQRLSGSLAAARNAEAADAEARLTRLSRFRYAMNALVLGFVVFVALYASRTPKAQPVSSAQATADMIRNLPPAVRPTPNPPVAVVRPSALPPATHVPPAISLPDAADLCVDLARVMDDRDVPGLLERAARVLEATRVIIWVADKEGSVLRPTLTHGITDRVLSRLTALDVAAENVTSLSFRSMRPQTASGAANGDAGAIAVPLVTAAGCTGVLAAETKDSKPTVEAVAVAKIIAAQFATIIAPDDFSSVRVAEA